MARRAGHENRVRPQVSWLNDHGDLVRLPGPVDPREGRSLRDPFGKYPVGGDEHCVRGRVIDDLEVTDDRGVDAGVEPGPTSTDATEMRQAARKPDLTITFLYGVHVELRKICQIHLNRDVR
jgi:hypothetical protein